MLGRIKALCIDHSHKCPRLVTHIPYEEEMSNSVLFIPFVKAFKYIVRFHLAYVWSK